MKHSIDYLSMIQSIPAHRTALIEDGQFYTYGSLTGCLLYTSDAADE